MTDLDAISAALEIRKLRKALKEARAILTDEPITHSGPEYAAWLERVRAFMEQTKCVQFSPSPLLSGSAES